MLRRCSRRIVATVSSTHGTTCVRTVHLRTLAEPVPRRALGPAQAPIRAQTGGRALKSAVSQLAIIRRAYAKKSDKNAGAGAKKKRSAGTGKVGDIVLALRGVDKYFEDGTALFTDVNIGLAEWDNGWP